MRKHSAIWVGVTAMACLGGCGTTAFDPQVIRQDTYTIHAPHAVFDSSQVVDARLHASPGSVPVPLNDAGEPWWATRNDDRLASRPGANQATASSYTIHTRDQQYSRGGRIHNSHHRQVRTFTFGW